MNITIEWKKVRETSDNTDETECHQVIRKLMKCKISEEPPNRLTFKSIKIDWNDFNNKNSRLLSQHDVCAVVISLRYDDNNNNKNDDNDDDDGDMMMSAHDRLPQPLIDWNVFALTI